MATIDRPPTTQCPVKLTLKDGRELDVTMYLLADSSRVSGVISVPHLLDISRGFLAVATQNGKRLMVNKEAIVAAELDSTSPGAPDVELVEQSFDVVTVSLATGQTYSGVLPSVTSEDHPRMSDFLNQPNHYLTLESGGKVIVIRKLSIVSISF